MLIKPGLFMRGIAALSAGATLAACMSGREMPAPAGHAPMMGGHAGAATASGAPPATARPDEMEMRRMCRMQHDIQRAPAAERQAMMEQHMKGMSPDMRRHQTEMMQQHCR